MISIYFRIILCLLIFCFTNACKQSNTNEKTTSTEQIDSCSTNPKHTYQVFIPEHDKTLTSLPLLIAIDSHGSGKNAVQHFKKAVSEYPAIVVASNLIQNNDAHYTQELDELIADVKQKYPVDETIYFTGFSGGARMALGYAVNHNTNGVIACGAFAQAQQINTIKCPVIGLIGMDDFNFQETLQYIFAPVNAPANAHIELTNAAHEWPSSDRLRDVFGWLRLSNKADKTIDKHQIKNYIKTQHSRIDSLAEQGDFIQAVCIARNMAATKTFEEIGSFQSKTKELLENTAYKKQISQLKSNLSFESKVRQAYSKALLDKDKDWWTKEIADLHSKIETESDKMKQMTYKRLNGFLGIICYSYSRKFANEKNILDLEKVLNVYRIAEPDNADMKHFSEILETLKKR